jgi:hypothetical protein
MRLMLMIPILLALACDQGSSTSAPASPVSAAEACDPLTPVTLPVAPGKVVGLGQDAAGTVYLVDAAERASSSYRVFVSRGAMTLVRLVVTGSGGDASVPGSRVLVSTEDASGPFQLEIEGGDAGPSRMGLLRGPLPSSKFFTIGVDGDTLKVLPPADVGGYTLQNLPGTFDVALLGRVADGRMVVVIGPDVDARLEDFRVFFGPADHLIERRLVNAAVGSYSSIRFAVDDDHQATAVFGSEFNTFVTSHLEIDGQSLPLAVSDDRAALAGATFYCVARAR